jgi:predicted enzyme related to lactoylglutathione lyase
LGGWRAYLSETTLIRGGLRVSAAGALDQPAFEADEGRYFGVARSSFGRRFEDVKATLERAEQLGGKTIQPAQTVPGVTFGVFADAQGHVVGVAAQA